MINFHPVQIHIRRCTYPFWVLYRAFEGAVQLLNYSYVRKILIIGVNRINLAYFEN